MKTFLDRKALEHAQLWRPAAYLRALEQAGQMVGEHLQIDSEVLAAIKAKHGIGECRPPAELPLPSKLQMARNLGRSVARNLKGWLGQRRLQAPRSLRRKRWRICKACPFFRPSDKRCSKCGCFTQGWLLNKINLQSEVCPDQPPRW